MHVAPRQWWRRIPLLSQFIPYFRGNRFSVNILVESRKGATVTPHLIIDGKQVNGNAIGFSPGLERKAFGLAQASILPASEVQLELKLLAKGAGEDGEGRRGVLTGASFRVQEADSFVPRFVLSFVSGTALTALAWWMAG